MVFRQRGRGYSVVSVNWGIDQQTPKTRALDRPPRASSLISSREPDHSTLPLPSFEADPIVRLERLVGSSRPDYRAWAIYLFLSLLGCSTDAPLATRLGTIPLASSTVMLLGPSLVMLRPTFR